MTGPVNVADPNVSERPGRLRRDVDLFGNVESSQKVVDRSFPHDWLAFEPARRKADHDVELAHADESIESVALERVEAVLDIPEVFVLWTDVGDMVNDGRIDQTRVLRGWQAGCPLARERLKTSPHSNSF